MVDQIAQSLGGDPTPAPSPPENPKRKAFNKAFYDGVRNTVFAGSLNSSQVENMRQIIDAWLKVGDNKADTLSYALATCRHEVGREMAPVREGFAQNDKEARQIVRRRKYGKPTGPYGHVYYGRGYPQLTWEDNYRNSSKDVGVDLLQFPDQMLIPEIAAKLLIIGLIDGRWNGEGHGISHYLQREKPDLKNARRTVNITDKWEIIADYYHDFKAAVDAGVMAMKAINAVPVPPKPPVVDPVPVPDPVSEIVTSGDLGAIKREAAELIAMGVQVQVVFQVAPDVNFTKAS